MIDVVLCVVAGAASVLLAVHAVVLGIKIRALSARIKRLEGAALDPFEDL